MPGMAYFKDIEDENITATIVPSAYTLTFTFSTAYNERHTSCARSITPADKHTTKPVQH
jgi:hypothetical protein